MRNLHLNWSNQSRFVKYCCISAVFALLAGFSLFYFGSRLSPESVNYQQGEHSSRAVEALAYSNAVVKRCIEAQTSSQPEECDNLKEILEILQRALDLGTQESLAGSTYHLSKLGYWQYLVTGWTVIFLMLTVGASYAFLFEASHSIRYVKDTLRVTQDNCESELQPYLTITDVSVQTGEPTFGGGDGWIDITFKNFGKTPAWNFRNHQIEESPSPLFSQYVEMLGSKPAVHTIRGPGNASKTDTSESTVLLDLINIGEERTVRCPIVTDILDRSVKQSYMENEWERRREGVSLPQFEGYRIRGSIDFSNYFHNKTTRRLRFELADSIDNGKHFTIIEDVRLT